MISITQNSAWHILGTQEIPADQTKHSLKKKKKIKEYVYRQNTWGNKMDLQEEKVVNCDKITLQ